MGWRLPAWLVSAVSAEPWEGKRKGKPGKLSTSAFRGGGLDRRKNLGIEVLLRVARLCLNHRLRVLAAGAGQVLWPLVLGRRLANSIGNPCALRTPPSRPRFKIHFRASVCLVCKGLKPAHGPASNSSPSRILDLPCVTRLDPDRPEHQKYFATALEELDNTGLSTSRLLSPARVPSTTAWNSCYFSGSLRYSLTSILKTQGLVFLNCETTSGPSLKRRHKA